MTLSQYDVRIDVGAGGTIMESYPFLDSVSVWMHYRAEIIAVPLNRSLQDLPASRIARVT